MPQCQGIKSDRSRCVRQDDGFIHLGATHLHFCRIHWGVYQRRVETRRPLTVVVQEQHHRAGTCHHWIRDRWCGRVCEGNGILCDRHGTAAAERQIQRQAAVEQQRQRDLRIQQCLAWYYEQQPAMTWRQVVDHMVLNPRENFTNVDMYRVCIRYFTNPLVIDPEFTHHWQFEMYWRWNIRGRVGIPPDLLQLQIVPPPPLRNNLAAIAADRQNVHTRVVSEQTNKGLEKLLEESKTSGSLRAPEWFAARWLIKSYGKWDNVVRTVNDMIRWYDTRSCRTHNDWLYEKALNGLYSMIRKLKDNETKQELYQRVFEECFESIGLCCDGHISRLCNVLVGFDETFVSDVPFGEILQNKMAAIAALDIDTSEKVRQATEFFNEFAVPETERSAWLEAF